MALGTSYYDGILVGEQRALALTYLIPDLVTAAVGFGVLGLRHKTLVGYAPASRSAASRCGAAPC